MPSVVFFTSPLFCSIFNQMVLNVILQSSTCFFFSSQLFLLLLFIFWGGFTQWHSLFFDSFIFDSFFLVLFDKQSHWFSSESIFVVVVLLQPFNWYWRLMALFVQEPYWFAVIFGFEAFFSFSTTAWLIFQCFCCSVQQPHWFGMIYSLFAQQPNWVGIFVGAAYGWERTCRFFFHSCHNNHPVELGGGGVGGTHKVRFKLGYSPLQCLNLEITS